MRPIPDNQGHCAGCFRKMDEDDKYFSIDASAHSGMEEEGILLMLVVCEECKERFTKLVATFLGPRKRYKSVLGLVYDIADEDFYLKLRKDIEKREKEKEKHKSWLQFRSTEAANGFVGEQHIKNHIRSWLKRIFWSW